MKKKRKNNKTDKIINLFIVVVIIFTIFALGYSIKITFFNKVITEEAVTQMPTKNSMKLTAFDKALARQMMDKNNDGKCDACGMPVEMCMDSGQLQCNMDSESTIGELGSQHIHVDWKVYINDNFIDFTGKDHMTGMRSGSSVSSFIHVDSGAPAPEKTGDVLHMHATGVPLWIFFNSIEMELPNSTKVYINGGLTPEGLNYVFNDLDKILITYGNETQEEIKNQINSITDYAKNH